MAMRWKRFLRKSLKVTNKERLSLGMSFVPVGIINCRLGTRIDGSDKTITVEANFL